MPAAASASARRLAARRSTSQTSPSPISARAQWASGREVAAGAERAVLGDDRREPGVRAVASIVSASTGRAPEQPIASERARSSIIARTTSRSTGSPIPAACERISARCSSSRRSGGIAVVRERAEPGRDPVGRLVGLGEPLDHRCRLRHRGARLVGEPRGAACRATAITPRRSRRRARARSWLRRPRLSLGEHNRGEATPNATALSRIRTCGLLLHGRRFPWRWRNRGFEIDFVERVRGALPNRWRRRCRRKVGGSDLVLVEHEPATMRMMKTLGIECTMIPIQALWNRREG